MDAVILLNKPKGMTSFSAVSQCRHIFHEKKAGHTGTLDPDATGLMIVLLGRYTKLAPFCVKDHKHYKAEFIMGEKRNTGDISGEVVCQKEPRIHSDEELNATCQSFLGEIDQIPPMYSAVKVNGKKLYELARKGQDVERKPRKVVINHLEVRRKKDNIYTMDAVVSSGTYVRTLIEDFCESLQELGTMTSLVRTDIESLSISDALCLYEMKEDTVTLDPLRVIDPVWKIIDMPEREADIKNGRRLKLNIMDEKIILTNGKEILAAYEKKEDQLYHCVRGLF